MAGTNTALVYIDSRSQFNTEVRIAMYYGTRLSMLPEYEKTNNIRAVDCLDTQVFEGNEKAQ
ncbi:PNPOx family protein [Cohnella abietis]|uniref:Uncharacterized protein n=1 Tax=Cohnella abietis TaxID=2507935 RepID=A0A3T1D9M4_9BACL|nr:hypothetical protein [Cohnella abietis]BBI34698.1 hypothetical protein KCTCHS21_40970 [Cohnella abietis]